MSNRYDVFNNLCMRQVSLSEHSSYGIGGDADYYAMPETVEQLLTILDVCRTYGMEFFVFGMGTNVLFPEQPKRGTLYVSLKNFADFRMNGTKWFVSSGMPLSMLSLAGLISGTHEFQFTYLLPGCLGAGIYMNAKYLDDQMGSKIETVYYVDLSDQTLSLQTIRAEDCQFSYKHSIFQHKPWIIIGADIPVSDYDEPLQGGMSEIIRKYKNWNGKLSSLSLFYRFFTNELQELQNKPLIIPAPMRNIDQYRTGNGHFKYRSCGSFFKNNYNAGASIGALVDKLNLKGSSRGGAVISPYHGNMILNLDRATASDILYLKDTVSEAIHRHYGFIPEPEVVIVQ